MICSSELDSVIRSFTEAYQWRKEHLVEDDHSRLALEHALASAYLGDRRIKEAIRMLEHVVAVEKKTLAEDDDSRLASERTLTYALQMANQDGVYR
ncbi:hypothetical protein QBC46DRAFT_254807 [Diplogelasinospora grovesii]|uniref:Uncharacterized protein n=1 Tax=Diplogelasinospora grovesii TaxID=303347 RepID=A0AAN6S7C4_9PEZI|nr:hypothetical protein QBC46DRAFT_254807 [Diplogelasinospora grovesii]